MLNIGEEASEAIDNFPVSTTNVTYVGDWPNNQIRIPLPVCPGSSNIVNATNGERTVVCNNHGSCKRKPLSPCSQYGIYNTSIHQSLCLSTCNCDEGWVGSSCQLTRLEHEERVSLREYLLDALENVTSFSDLTSDSASQQAAGVLFLTASPKQLTSSAQTKGLSIIEQISANQASGKEQMNNPVPSTITSLAGSVSNLLDAGIFRSTEDPDLFQDCLLFNPKNGSTSSIPLKLDKSTVNCTQLLVSNCTSIWKLANCSGNETYKFVPLSMQISQKIAGVFGNLSVVSLNNIVAGEDLVVVVTKNVQMASMRQDVSKNASIVLPSSQAGGSSEDSVSSPMFQLPTIESLNMTSDDSFDIMAIQWTQNPHEWSGREMSSNTVTLSLRTTTAEPIQVLNSSEPFVFFLPRTGPLPEDNPIEMYVLNCPRTLNYTKDKDQSTTESRRRLRGSHFEAFRQLAEPESANHSAPLHRVVCSDGFVVEHQCGSIEPPEAEGTERNLQESLNRQWVVDREYNVTVHCPRNISVSSCEYWDEANLEWSSRGCEIVQVLDSGTWCSCNHLTDFASHLETVRQDVVLVIGTGVQLFTNPAFFLRAVVDNYSVFLTVLLVALLSVVCCAQARRLDLRDKRTIRAGYLSDVMTTKELSVKRKKSDFVHPTLRKSESTIMHTKSVLEVKDVRERNRKFFLERKESMFGSGNPWTRLKLSLKKSHKHLSVLYIYDDVFTRPKRVAVLITLLLVSYNK